jgi:hypothetical protein
MPLTQKYILKNDTLPVPKRKLMAHLHPLHSSPCSGLLLLLHSRSDKQAVYGAYVYNPSTGKAEGGGLRV